MIETCNKILAYVSFADMASVFTLISSTARNCDVQGTKAS